MSEKKPMETAAPRSIEERPLVTATCCFCIPLKVACFTLGYLTLLMNAFNTLIIVGAFIVASIMTQGFQYLPTEFGRETTDPVQDSILTYIVFSTGIMLLLNVIWLCWIIAVLVGLHKRRPGPVRLHLAVAIVRFLMLFISLVTSTGINNTIDLVILTCIEISITGYFIVVYHAYATRLQRRVQARVLTIESTPVPEISITDVYQYPKILDQHHLIVKEKY